MCGIVAAVGAPLERASVAIRHRGIRSTHIGPIIHHRLPIRDTSTEYDQPIIRGNWTLAFVGEFFNISGHEIDFLADNYLASGPKFLHELQQDGFWSIVAYNKTSDTLVGTTDYLGQKPLYYRTDIPALSSEPYSATKFAPVSIDKLYLSSVLKFGYCPDPTRTPYNEVKRLGPGETVYLARDKEPKVLNFDPLIPIPVPANTLKQYIIDAVKHRVMDSDVPIAMLRSTGLDSNIIYQCVYEMGLSERIRVLTLPEQADNPPEAPDPVDIDDQVEIFQEPIDLGSLTQQIYLAQQIYRTGGERVVISADAADELFGGYRRSVQYDSQYSDVFQELVCWHLPRLDRVHMRYLQEIRSPFLARNVVQAALALPRDLRTNKKILRELFKDELEDIGIDPNVKKIPMKRKDIHEDPMTNRQKLVDAFIKFSYERGVNIR